MRELPSGFHALIRYSAQSEFGGVYVYVSVTVLLCLLHLLVANVRHPELVRR